MSRDPENDPIVREMRRRAKPLVERSNEAGAFIAQAREKMQEAAELLQRAGRAIHGRSMESEVNEVASDLLVLAEGESDDARKSLRRLHAAVGESLKGELDAMQAAVMAEADDNGSDRS